MNLNALLDYRQGLIIFFFNRFSPRKAIMPLESRRLQDMKMEENEKSENGENSGKDRMFQQMEDGD